VTVQLLLSYLGPCFCWQFVDVVFHAADVLGCFLSVKKKSLVSACDVVTAVADLLSLFSAGACVLSSVAPFFMLILRFVASFLSVNVFVILPFSLSLCRRYGVGGVTCFLVLHRVHAARNQWWIHFCL
jgi:hypothetical protein